MILEELMLDMMYALPGQKRVKEFEVTREMVKSAMSASLHGEGWLITVSCRKDSRRG